MHVVQALASLSIGGSEFVATELTEALRQKGHRVTVLAAPGYLTSRVEASGARTLPWPVNRKRLGTLRYIWRIRRWLLEEQPNLIHVHSRLPALLIWRALLGLPEKKRPVLVTSMHGHYSVSPYSGYMARGDAVIAVSEAIREYTLHNYPVNADKIHVVHGGASRAAFPYGYKPPEDWWRSVHSQFPQLKGKRLLCLPGRLSRYKGHGDFINLLAGLVDDNPNIHGVILGTGRPGSRYHDELVGMAIAGGIRDRVTFTGERTDIREWIAASELIFNLCSDPPEAFGRTVLEALYLGRPVVAWDHGGVAEILAALYPAGAVPPEDTIALRIRAATLLRQAPPVENSRRFSLEESMKRTLEVYSTALAAQSRKEAKS